VGPEFSRATVASPPPPILPPPIIIITTKNNNKNVYGRELAREKVWARLHLIPLLEAENDRDLVRRQIAEAEREKALMGDVKGWKMGSVYNSDKVIRPRYGYGPDEELKGKPS